MASKSWSPTYLANQLWAKQPKANAELFALTYGALVAELVRDLETNDKIQAELDRMGHSMGIRSVEEFLAKASLEPQSQTAVTCSQFKDTSDVLKMALKMFLGITTEAGVQEDSHFSIQFAENPLSLFVELPPDRSDLEYSQLLCGYVRGMLEMLQFDVTVTMAQSVLRGDEINEMRVDLNQVLQAGAGDDYQEE
jgi:hypothetical protein